MQKLIIFFTVLLPLLAAGFDDCPETRCRKHGPPIRFPFKLKHIHAQHCGYPGFELFCDDSGNTVMELPHALKLHVQMIHYESQHILLFDPHGCLFGKTLLYLNLSQSPFQYSSATLTNYSLFNCSASNNPENFDVDQGLISCIGVPGHSIFAIPSYQSIDEFPSPSCLKFRETTIHYRIYPSEDTLQLSWLSPFCSTCEVQGKNCGLKNHNNITLGVQCLGTTKRAGRYSVTFVIDC
ncbi:PREDICTED: RING-H2 finger protein ATL22-like [Ipomoea nil]|uniref:RING-H2 finger protein ATL22-like n=1 Tax=Ipomoea nil TaxID=35883 RepID=UPI0009018F5D|nr:PREDICTED: RING-H2 finger protein ATL22-like [Ipomoea nil]